MSGLFEYTSKKSILFTISCLILLSPASHHHLILSFTHSHLPLTLVKTEVLELWPQQPPFATPKNRIGKMSSAAASSQLKSKGSLPQVLSPVKLHSTLAAQSPGHNSIRVVTNAEMSSFGLNPEDKMPFTPDASQTSCRLLLNSTQITDSPRMDATSQLSERSLHVCNLSPISLEKNDGASTRFLNENVQPRMEWMSKAVTQSLFPPLKKESTCRWDRTK
ncbi:uncharacterized protein LOC127036270 [Gopherus flavomarginatus]|uniref:uncharacterized protein LOC127036270 n=1 Tax=Gopherus flavomarginatus TaxID=286002 RepID=UPI0021CC1260|nr:uncharacterized protein LOC127036270 [Gopherus flavomarginatus]